MTPKDFVYRYRAEYWDDLMPKEATEAYWNYRDTEDKRLLGFIIRCIRAHWINKYPNQISPPLYNIDADDGLEALAQSCVTGGAPELNRLAMELTGDKFTKTILDFFKFFSCFFVLILTSCITDECQLSGVIHLTDGQSLVGCKVNGTIIIEGKDILVSNVSVNANGYKYGIIINPPSSDVTVQFSEVYGAWMSGIQSWSWPGRDNYNINVVGCVAHHNLGSREYTQNWSGSGIILGGVVDSKIEACIAYENGKLTNSKAKNGPVGIWLHNAKNSKIVNCKSYNNKTQRKGRDGGTSNHHDGGGFDIDGPSINCVIEDCHSWNNEGPGYLVWRWNGADESYGHKIINCVSENEDMGVVVGGRDGVVGTKVSRCTLINSDYSGYVRDGSDLTIRDSYICGTVLNTVVEINNEYCEPNN